MVSLKVYKCQFLRWPAGGYGADATRKQAGLGSSFSAGSSENASFDKGRFVRKMQALNWDTAHEQNFLFTFMYPKSVIDSGPYGKTTRYESSGSQQKVTFRI